MNYENTRISKLRDYLIGIIRTLTTNEVFQINADMLDNEVNNYSIDKMPTQSVVTRWINGEEIHRDAFTFRVRMAYSQDTINNLKNIGFFENFQKLINSNNRKGVLPDIQNIQEIQCLSNGTLSYADTKTAEFDIQIQITYLDNNEEGGDISL